MKGISCYMRFRIVDEMWESCIMRLKLFTSCFRLCQTHTIFVEVEAQLCLSASEFSFSACFKKELKRNVWYFT